MTDGSTGNAASGSTPGHAQQKNQAAPAYVDWGERFHGADSSILGTTAYKACCQCGIELNHRSRFKDSHGRYWCPECNAADHARHQPSPCEDCRTAYPRDQMKEDHGKFICEECLGKRLLGSVELAEPQKPGPASAAAISLTPARPERTMPLLVGGLVALAVAVAAVAYYLL